MVRILVLHGFAQSPDEIRSKTRQIQSSLSDTDFVFPSAAVELVSYDGEIDDRSRDVKSAPARFSWNYLHEDMSSHLFNLEATLKRIIPILEGDGPFVGIMGFSQGAAVASAITSLLEKRSVTINHPEFKFAVLFCGARPSSPVFDQLYQDIRTPSLHMVGELDVMVPIERSLQLASAFDTSTVIYHPGNHFIPQGTRFTKAVADFVRQHTSSAVLTPQMEVTGDIVRVDAIQSKKLSLLQEPRRPRKLRLIRRPSGFRVQMLVS